MLILFGPQLRLCFKSQLVYWQHWFKERKYLQKYKTTVIPSWFVVMFNMWICTVLSGPAAQLDSRGLYPLIRNWKYLNIIYIIVFSNRKIKWVFQQLIFLPKKKVFTWQFLWLVAGLKSAIWDHFRKKHLQHGSFSVESIPRATQVFKNGTAEESARWSIVEMHIPKKKGLLYLPSASQW